MPEALISFRQISKEFDLVDIAVVLKGVVCKIPVVKEKPAVVKLLAEREVQIVIKK